MPGDLDPMDMKLLECLQRDAWLSYAALARLVNLSPSAVQRRVERLISVKVIEGATIKLGDGRYAPQNLMVTLLIELADDRASTIDKFKKAVFQEAAIVDALYTTGEFDVVLRITLAKMQDYDRLLDRLCNRSALVRRFKTLTALRRLK